MQLKTEPADQERPSRKTTSEEPIEAPAEYGCHKKRQGKALAMPGPVQRTMKLVEM
jgi:hypothetical protein